MAPTTSTDTAPDRQAKAEAEHSAQVLRESALLDEAREDVRAGRVIADGEVDAWLGRFVRGEALSMPDVPSTRRGK